MESSPKNADPTLDNLVEQSADGSSSAAGAAPARENLFDLQILSQAKTADEFCSALADFLAVRATEVAMLSLRNGLLRFLSPKELTTAGTIPVSSSSAVAAHTAVSRKIELFNSFARVKHVSIFETLKFSRDPQQSDSAPIQKLMTAPVMDENRKVLGVLQVCRKGSDLQSAGPDFTWDDLHQLESAAQAASQLPFLKHEAAE
ncbi:MAG: hypothetical protein JOY93_06520 [Acidobacteriales bacterium]|nr:hypothetical protein [Terriglobales bacterium]